jgi:hypothetical protein
VERKIFVPGYSLLFRTIAVPGQKSFGDKNELCGLPGINMVQSIYNRDFINLPFYLNRSAFRRVFVDS